MKFQAITLVLTCLSKAQSRFLRNELSTESSSADAFTESSSADEPLALTRTHGAFPLRFNYDGDWEKYLKENLDEKQYASISPRSLHEVVGDEVHEHDPEDRAHTFDDEDPIIWISGSWDPPGWSVPVETVSSIDTVTISISDYPSMTPSDFPSLAPSDFPSLAPSEMPVSIDGDDPEGRSFTFMDDEPVAVEQQTLLELVMDKFELNWFKIMLDKGDVKHILAEKEGITVMAPVNSAFQSLDRRLLGKLLLPEYALHVRDLVRYHLMWWKFTSDGLVVDRRISTMEQDGVLWVALGDNGDIQLRSANGPPASFLDTDISGSNGELHIIDQVLLPEFLEADAMTVLEDSVENMSLLFQTISHNKFLAMVQAAGLEETMRGLEEATVFLPDDDGIDDEVYEYLMLPENAESLKAVVEYHIIPFALNFELFNFMTPHSYTTIQGESMSITRRVGLVVDDHLTISLTLMKCGHVYHTNGLLVPPSMATGIMGPQDTPI